LAQVVNQNRLVTHILSFNHNYCVDDILYTEVSMSAAITYLDNDSVIFYSCIHDSYYLKNLLSQLVSLKDYRTADEALVSFINNRVMWVEDIKE